MKKLYSLIIVAVLLVPGFVLAGNPTDTSHPIFQERDWKIVQTDDLKWISSWPHQSVVYGTAILYENQIGEYNLLEFTFFGENTFRVYIKNYPMERWLQFERDGATITLKYPYYDWYYDFLEDGGNALRGIRVRVKDGVEHKYYQWEVKRKDVAPAAFSDKEKELIEKWIQENDLDRYGNPDGTMYLGGTPLFDEKTGQLTDRYGYILKNHPDKPWFKK